MSRAVILDPEYILDGPSESARTGLAIVVCDDRIGSIGPLEELKRQWMDADVISLPNCIAVPGLVNAHQHGRGVSQIQLGYPDDFLEPWIAGRKARGRLDARAVTRLAAARMLANGVTTAVHANYSYGSGDYEREVRDQIAAYETVGMRVTMCVGAMDRGSTVYPPHEACFMAGLPEELQGWLSTPAVAAYAGGADETIAMMKRLHRDFADRPLVRLCYGPAGPQWVSDYLWSAIARDARDNNFGIHLHALESPAQKLACTELFPAGVFAHLDSLGVLTSNTVIAHGIWVDDDDMRILARTGATVVRNPGCNLRMRNGIAPLARYLQHGVRVAIGTDNCSLDDDEDLLSELRLAGNLAREPNWNGPPPPTPEQLMAMATVNGAVAAGLSGRIGNLSAGMLADIAVFSLARTRNPYLDSDMDVLSAFLARGRGEDTVLTMVNGRVLYRDGRHVHLSIEVLEAEAAKAAFAARLPVDPSNRARTARLRGHICEHYRGLSAKPPIENR